METDKYPPLILMLPHLPEPLRQAQLLAAALCGRAHRLQMTTRPAAQAELVMIRAGAFAAQDAAVHVQHQLDAAILDLARQQSQARLGLRVARDLGRRDEGRGCERLGAVRADLRER